MSQIWYDLMTQLSLASNQAEVRKFSRDAKMRSSTPEAELVRSKTPALSGAWYRARIVVAYRKADAARDYRGTIDSRWHYDERRRRSKSQRHRPVQRTGVDAWHRRAATRPIHVSSNSCVCWLAMRRGGGTNKPTRSKVQNAPDFTGDRFMKVVLYARYSSDNQRDASIADQFRVCRAYAEKQGWRVVEEYSDHAISGASLHQRPRNWQASGASKPSS